MQIEYTGDTVMHVGMHQNKFLKDIPASYFLYIYKGGFVNPLMRAYIEKNLHRFEIETLAEKQQRKSQNNYERK